MVPHHVLAESAGPHLLLGNEAIARGALEAGVRLVTCYPGTPSSEVPDTFRQILFCKRFALEYSVNEKVALEVGGGAALAGAMTLTTMKHVGVNVAADPLLTMAYTGLPGGLVLLSADDPGCHSSQNEQDNRYYARFAGMPCFEPATAQEAKDMTREALLLARETGQPALLRTTTRVNHLRGPVTYSPLPEPAAIVPFARDPRRFVPVPAVARLRHKAMSENLEFIREKAERSSWNRESGQGKKGVIASGISRMYLRDALASSDWSDKVRVLELGFTWPLPLRRIAAFLQSVDSVLVLEEAEPLLEQDIRALAHKLGICIPVFGKGGPLTIFGEYSVPAVREAVASFLGKTLKTPPARSSSLRQLPQRPPNLCAGCGHRSLYYAVRKVFGDAAAYSSDIGCYTLGLLPPLATADFLFCMGSSVSAGSGFARFSDRPVVAFIGDSTFFHSGITGLVNAVFNKHNLLLVILDNGTTAMTGHQPNPGVAQDVLGSDCVRMDIATVVKGCGVTRVAKVKPHAVKANVKILEEMKQLSGVRVVIAEGPCVLFARRVLQKKRGQTAYVAEQGAGAHAVMETLACPAFALENGKLSVDPSLCTGCMVCLQIAPNFRARKKDTP